MELFTQTLFFYDYLKNKRFHRSYFENFKKDITTNSCE